MEGRRVEMSRRGKEDGRKIKQRWNKEDTQGWNRKRKKRKQKMKRRTTTITEKKTKEQEATDYHKQHNWKGKKRMMMMRL